MNKSQRENLAKYCYDISKLSFAAFVVANIMSEKFSLPILLAGIICGLNFLVMGLLLNTKE